MAKPKKHPPLATKIFDRIIMDDPHAASVAECDTALWFGELLSSRLKDDVRTTTAPFRLRKDEF